MLTAIVTATLCFLAYNFFFIEPRWTLYISAQRGLTTALVFLAGALIAGRLAAHLRMQVVALGAANAHATAMQNLGQQLAKAADLGQVIAAGASVLQSALQADVWLRIHQTTGPASAAGLLSEKDLAAADWTQQHGKPSGRHTDTLAQSDWWFLPVRSDQDALGVVALRFRNRTAHLGFEQRRLAESVVDDVGQAALRTRLVADLEVARVSGETERLRSALLSSVSHDLRSPLSSIIGSADSLLSYGKDMDEQDRHSLLETIHLEGEQLNRYIQNLLDMTRLGHQGLTLTRDWIGIDELVGSAARRLQRYLPQVRIELDLPPELPPIHVHPALIEHALFNVMENAAKFSPPEAPIRVAIGRSPEGLLRIDVSDQGPGIPESERHRIFDMFYSVERGDRGQQGTGLGLTIVQGIIGAHMGAVEALPDRDGNEVLKELRQWSGVPVIVLTVRSSEEQKVALLDAGANDYVTKPFGIEELMARIRSLLRNAWRDETATPVYDDGTLRIDLAAREVQLHGQGVALTRKEFALLSLLARQPGRIITQPQLLREMWGPTHQDDAHYLRILVGKLRAKLGDDASAPTYIMTEPGVGLRFIGRERAQP